MNLELQAAQKALHGTITLEGSKSISNRLLILRALSTFPFAIENLSPGDDTEAMQRILASQELVCDAGAAGTTIRFLTSYFAIQQGERILTGSERMKQRPIGILVDALRTIGADITYTEKEGYPPLHIRGKKMQGGRLQIRSDVSSQYISSLFMIAPVLENGLELELIGKISSLPYLQMTLRLMHSLGAAYTAEANIFSIKPGKYSGSTILVESDWSAASYYFSCCALRKNSHLVIKGLFADSLQGDSVLPAIYSMLGVQSSFKGSDLILQQQDVYTAFFDYDFSDCPDLAQTVVVTCAALGIPGIFRGLESLKIKETDRTQALADELSKFGVEFTATDDNTMWALKGKTHADKPIRIKTYEDHRMAMCFAPLSLLHEHIIIEDGEVVNKSYPSFWEDVSSIGISSSFTG